MVHIVVAFPKAETGKKIKNILVQSGCHVTHVVSSGAGVLAAAHELEYGIAVVSYRLGDMIYRELKEDLPPGFSLLVIATGAQWRDGGDPGVTGLLQPIRVGELLDAVEMLSRKVRQSKKRIKNMPKQRSGEDRETIRRAKELLMQRNSMTEEEAHRYLQQSSMNRGFGLVKMASEVLRSASGTGQG